MTPLLLDIGMAELLAIAVLAALFLGPEKVPPLAKKAARVFRFLRNVANTATDQIKTELGPEFEDLQDLNPKNLVGSVLSSDTDPMTSELEALKNEMNGMRTEVTKMRLQTGTPLFPMPTRPKPAVTPPQPTPPPSQEPSGESEEAAPTITAAPTTPTKQKQSKPFNNSATT
ncbi:MAG: hypothetical protein LBG99_09485 [Propionibacteriaceae bacterium]|jgi:sec-independent protein translocase protein TatB|nr:hypothetical protein [Propionibacteriaceae bacterium]